MKTKIVYNVTFYSPGSFFAESDTKEFNHFSLQSFCEYAKTIKQRHGATPYGFTWEKVEKLIDVPEVKGFEINAKDKILDKSKGMIYITGEIIFSENLTGEDQRILRRNLECNNNGIGIINTNSYKFHAGFNKEDAIVGWHGIVTTWGDDAELMEYRKKFK